MRLLVLALLFGASVAMADVPATSDPSAASQPLPLSIWIADNSGGLQHLQSGLTCPVTVGGYRRGRIGLYNAFGLDVSCDYVAGTTLITLYLARRTSSGVDADMAEAKRELLEMGAAHHPQVLSESRSAESGLDWVKALYAEDGGLHSGIWIADLDGWTLEYRATYAAADDAQIVADLKLMTAMVQSSAGARLALCSKSPPPKRGAAVITDKQEIEQSSMMTSLLGGGGAAAVQQGKESPEAPVIWCVEDAIKKAGHAMTFWRGVEPDGSDAGLDQISLATMETPPTLVVQEDRMANLISDLAMKGNKPPRWVASLHTGDQVLIFAYFNGRPASDAVSDLFVSILTHEAKALGGYSVHGKTVTINVPGR